MNGYMEYYVVLKKEQRADTCYSVDEPGKHYAGSKNPGAKDQILPDPI